MSCRVKPDYLSLGLDKRVQVEWDKIDIGTCQNLIERMPKRVEAVIEAVIKAKGGYIKY
jgi:hypothetical protein